MLTTLNVVTRNPIMIVVESLHIGKIIYIIFLFHPNCKRIISMNGSSTKLKGTDGSPGCPADGSGKAWSLDGIVKGNEIFVDFTPKGGPKDLKGVWDGSGINWPDGSKWSIKN